MKYDKTVYGIKEDDKIVRGYKVTLTIGEVDRIRNLLSLDDKVKENPVIMDLVLDLHNLVTKDWKTIKEAYTNEIR